MEMVEMGIVDKMNGIFKNVMNNNQEWCTDHLLEIINETLHMASEIMKRQYDKANQASVMSSQEKQAPDVLKLSFC